MSTYHGGDCRILWQFYMYRKKVIISHKLIARNYKNLKNIKKCVDLGRILPIEWFKVFFGEKRPLEDGMRRVINELFMTMKITLGVRRAASEGNVADLYRYFVSGLWAYRVNCDSRVVGDKVTFGISSNHALTALSNILQMISCYSFSRYYFVSQGIIRLNGQYVVVPEPNSSGRMSRNYSGQVENLHR